MRWQKSEQKAVIPMRTIGPIKIISKEIDQEVFVPLATFESPLWPSTHRGARICSKAGGIRAVLVDERMSRSILVEADSLTSVIEIRQQVLQKKEYFQNLVKQHSRYAQLIDIHVQVIGRLMYFRMEFTTGDAAGHNMVTLASDHILNDILQTYTSLKYVSISGNYCSDKKAGAVNGILGRGKNVIAEVMLPRFLVKRYLQTTPEKIVELNIKKNLLGNIAAGSLRTANAHFANMLLAFYLATGQDAANIIEGSQGFVHAEVRNDDLYFSVTLPNLILGTVGNGKALSFVHDNLKLLGCTEVKAPGENARRLAIIAASVILCGELSLLAAQTNQGELMQSHLKLERNKEAS